MFATLLGLIVIAWLVAALIKDGMMRFGYVPRDRRPDVVAQRRARIQAQLAINTSATTGAKPSTSWRNVSSVQQCKRSSIP